jgi:hypothetical protein
VFYAFEEKNAFEQCCENDVQARIRFPFMGEVHHHRFAQGDTAIYGICQSLYDKYDRLIAFWRARWIEGVVPKGRYGACTGDLYAVECMHHSLQCF